MGRDISGTTFFRAEIYWGRLLTSITGSSSRLLRIRFSADLSMYWFPVCHFRCIKFKPLVIWIWNQNIAISTIVRTSSHIILFNPFSFLVPKRLLDYLVVQEFDLYLTWRRLFQIRFMCRCSGIYVFTLNVI